MKKYKVIGMDFDEFEDLVKNVLKINCKVDYDMGRVCFYDNYLSYEDIEEQIAKYLGIENIYLFTSDTDQNFCFDVGILERI